MRQNSFESWHVDRIVELSGQQTGFVLCKELEFYHSTGSLCEEASEPQGNDRAMLRFRLFPETSIYFR